MGYAPFSLRVGVNQCLSRSINGRQYVRGTMGVQPDVASAGVADRAVVQRIETCAIRLVAHDWPLVREHRHAIDELWAQKSAANSGFFDGVVHLVSGWRLDGGNLTATAFATRFRDYLYWRETGFADRSVTDAFGAAIIRAADGGILLARQRSGNVNSGLVYLPGGFIDERDVGSGGVIDIDGSIEREIAEETGLDLARLERRPGYVVTAVGAHLAIAACWHSSVGGEALCRQVGDYLSADPTGELEHLLLAERREDLLGLPLVHYCKALLPTLLP